MSIFTRTNFVRRSVTLAAICGAGVAVMSAQTSQPAATTQAPLVTAQAVDFSSYATPVFATSPLEEDASSSSSSSAGDDVATASIDPLHLNAMQYNGRRRYGKPRYRGGNTNADGSNKWIFYGGAGFAQPSGNTWRYFTPSWGIQVGGGRQFNKHLALPVEFNYDHLGLTKQAISNESIIFFGDPNAADFGMDANAHIWSFSVQPTYTLLNGESGDGFGAYVSAGVGFYHKVTNFTLPEEEEFCEFFCEVAVFNTNFDHYTSNAPGFDAAVGVTYKFSHFANERFYGEARYVFIDNSQRQGLTVANSASNPNFAGTDFFPANSNHTTYFPIKFGMRF